MARAGFKKGKKMIRRTFNRIFFSHDRLYKKINDLEKRITDLLRLKYQTLIRPGDKKMALAQKEFKVYSQSGEDGLLLYIFSQIGATNHYFAEVGCGDGRTCNTANLSQNFNWQGILIDYFAKNIEIARACYQNKPVKVVKAFVTKENINQVLTESGAPGEIDLLTIDIDGNDYWLWQAINAVKPRVVMMEYNASLGFEPVTIKYEPDFLRYRKHSSGWYHGASLSALNKLAENKGYVLIGCSQSGVNAFFVRRDVLGSLPTMTPEEAFYPHSSRIQKMSAQAQLETIKHLPLEHV